MSQPIQGVLNLKDTTDSGNPTSGSLDFYAQSLAGFMLARLGGPNNADTAIQTSLGFTKIAMIAPMNSTTIGQTNIAVTTTSVSSGAVGTSTPGTSSLFNSIKAMTLTSSTGNTSLIAVRPQVLEYWLGNSAGLGGFFFVARFGMSSIVPSTTRAFIGLSGTLTVPTNQDPTTSLTINGSVNWPRIGMGINANTGNWKFITSVGGGTSGTVTAVDLGSNIPVNTTDLIELCMYCPPNGSSITYRIVNLTTGNIVTGSTSTNLPASTTFMGPFAIVTNNTTTSTVTMNIARIYIESDY